MFFFKYTLFVCLVHVPNILLVDNKNWEKQGLARCSILFGKDQFDLRVTLFFHKRTDTIKMICF